MNEKSQGLLRDLMQLIPISPQEPLGDFASGEQTDGLSDRYGCHIFCSEHHSGTENIPVYLSRGVLDKY